MSRKQRAQQRKRADQSRENGANSKGPTSDRGKQESSLNALKHGLASSAIILLEGESREKLEAIIGGAIDIYRPQNEYEVALTEAHISALWRSRRAAAFETALFNVQMQLDAPELKKQFTVIDPTTRQALTYKTLSQSIPSPQQLARYEAELCRSSKRWLDMLKDAQQIRRANELDDQLAFDTPASPPTGLTGSLPDPVQAVPRNEPSSPLASTNQQTCEQEPAPSACAGQPGAPPAGPDPATPVYAVPRNEPSSPLASTNQQTCEQERNQPSPVTPASAAACRDNPQPVPPQPARLPKVTPEQVMAESQRVRDNIGYRTGYYPKN